MNPLEGRNKKAFLNVNNKVYPLYAGLNTIGRHKQATVVLKDETVSQGHATIVILNDLHYLSDIKSINGTFINDQKLNSLLLYALENNSKLKFANVEATYTVLSNSCVHEDSTKAIEPTQSELYLGDTQILEVNTTNGTDNDFDDNNFSGHFMDAEPDLTQSHNLTESVKVVLINEMPTQLLSSSPGDQVTSIYDAPTQLFPLHDLSEKSLLVNALNESSNLLENQPIADELVEEIVQEELVEEEIVQEETVQEEVVQEEIAREKIVQEEIVEEEIAQEEIPRNSPDKVNKDLKTTADNTEENDLEENPFCGQAATVQDEILSPVSQLQTKKLHRRVKPLEDSSDDEIQSMDSGSEVGRVKRKKLRKLTPLSEERTNKDVSGSETDDDLEPKLNSTDTNKTSFKVKYTVSDSETDNETTVGEHSKSKSISETDIDDSVVQGKDDDSTNKNEENDVIPSTQMDSGSDDDFVFEINHEKKTSLEGDNKRASEPLTEESFRLQLTDVEAETNSMKNPEPVINDILLDATENVNKTVEDEGKENDDNVNTMESESIANQEPVVHGKDIFLQPTQKITNTSVEDIEENYNIIMDKNDDIFLAPTQVMNEQFIASSHRLHSDATDNEDVFLQATQKIESNTSKDKDTFLAPMPKTRQKAPKQPSEDIFLQPTQRIDDTEKTREMVDREDDIFLQATQRNVIEEPKQNAAAAGSVESQLEVIFASQNVKVDEVASNRPINPLAEMLDSQTDSPLICTLSGPEITINKEDIPEEEKQEESKEITCTRKSTRNHPSAASTTQNDGATKSKKIDEVDKKIFSKVTVVLESCRIDIAASHSKKDEQDAGTSVKKDKNIKSTRKSTRKTVSKVTKEEEEPINSSETAEKAETIRPKRRKLLKTPNNTFENNSPERSEVTEVSEVTTVKEMKRKITNRVDTERITLKFNAKDKAKMNETELSEESEDDMFVSNQKRRKITKKKDSAKNYEETSTKQEVVTTPVTRGKRTTRLNSKSSASTSSGTSKELPPNKRTKIAISTTEEPKERRTRARSSRNESNIKVNEQESNDTDTSLNSTASKRSILDNTMTRLERNRRVTKPKVVFTMLDSPELESAIRSLGGSVVDTVDSCTVLVTSNVKRTLKLLSAIGLGKPVCSSDWILESKKSRTFLDPWEHIIVDKEAEKKWKFSLRESLQRSTNSKLLQGYSFQILVTTATDVLKAAIESCGGKSLTKSPANTTNFIVISSPENKTKHKKFLKDKNIRIVSAEAIFDGVLRQELHWDQFLISQI